MGPNLIFNKGNLDKNYDENICSNYTKNENIEITIDFLWVEIILQHILWIYQKIILKLFRL